MSDVNVFDIYSPVAPQNILQATCKLKKIMIKISISLL